VLATILVSKEFDVEDGGSRDTRGGAYYKATGSGYATGYYGAYGVPVVYGEFQTAPSIMTMKGEVRITTKVFETRGATLVYTLDTVAPRPRVARFRHGRDRHADCRSAAQGRADPLARRAPCAVGHRGGIQ